MFKSKQFFLSLGLAVLIGILVGGVYFTQRNKLPEIFEYIPTGMDQVMVNRAEKNMRNNANMLIEIPQAVLQQFQKIKVMIIVQDQSFDGDQLLFLSTKSDFDPQEFLKTINPDGEIIYTYIRLDKGKYVFGPQLVIQKYSKPSLENSLFSQSELKKYIPKIRKSSLSIVSQKDHFIGLEQYSPFLDSAKYLIMNIYSSPRGDFDFSAYILFSENYKEIETEFKPKFKSYFTESSIAYLELGKINSQINFESQEYSLYDDLINKILANNLAIIIGKGANMFNLGISILFDDPLVFDYLEQLFPLIPVFLEQQNFLNDSQISSFQQPGKIGYDILIQGFQKIGIYLEQEDKKTKLTIGNPTIEGKKQKIPKYSKNSLAILQVDINQLMSIYKQILNISTNPLSLEQQSAFDKMGDKTFYGQVSLEKDSISIKGSIR